MKQDYEVRFFDIRQTVLEQSQLTELYISLQAKYTTNPEEEPFDLSQKVQSFIEFKDGSISNPKVMLLMGDTGSGKSLFSQHLHQQLWKVYKKGNPIPLWIPLPELTNPFEGAVEEVLEKYGFDDSQIAKMKADQKFIFIVDGYDELHQFQNCYVTNKWSAWNAKILITCRSQALYYQNDTDKYFVPFQGERRLPSMLDRLYVAAFSQAQIQAYVGKYNNLNPLQKIDPNDLNKIPGLKDIISTPFLLSLAVQTLPDILQKYKVADEKDQKITQALLYDVFIENWFTRQVEKLKAAGQLKEEPEITKQQFWDYCKSLAQEMHTREVTYIPFVNDQKKTGRLFGKKLENEKSWEKYFNTHSEVVRSACPLRKWGENRYGFIHASFIEYFATRAMYEEIQVELIQEKPIIKPVGARRQDNKLRRGIHQRLFARENQAVRFLADRIVESDVFKKKILDIINTSKNDERYSVGAANAITALNCSGSIFSNMDLSDIKIPGAVMHRSTCDHTNFTRANLENVDFSQAWLADADFSSANLKEISFGELPKYSVNGLIESMHYTSDSRWLISAVNDKIYIFDIENHRVSSVLSGHTKAICALAVFPDDKLIVTGSYDTTARVWSLETRKMMLLLEGHESNVSCVAVSPCGNTIATSSLGSIFLWDAQSGELDHRISAHDRGITNIVYNSEGSMLISSGMDDSVCVHDVNSGERSYAFKIDNSILGTDLVSDLSEINKHKMALQSTNLASVLSEMQTNSSQLASLSALSNNTQLHKVVERNRFEKVECVFQKNGKLFAASSFKSNVIELRNIESGLLIFKLNNHVKGVTHILFSHDGSLLVSSSREENIINIWSVLTGDLVLSIKDMQKVNALVFSHNDKMLVCYEHNGTVKIFDIPRGDLLRTFVIADGDSSGYQNLSFNKNDSILAVGSGRYHHFFLIDNEPIKDKEIRHYARVMALVELKNKNTLITVSSDRTIKYWDSTNGQILRTLDLKIDGLQMTGAVFNPDTTKLLITYGLDQGASVFDIDSGLKLFEVNPKCTSISACFDQKSGCVITPTKQGIEFFNTLNGKKKNSLRMENVELISCSSSGSIAAVIYDSNVNQMMPSLVLSYMIALGNTSSTGLKILNPLKFVIKHPKLLFSPDGQILAVSGKENDTDNNKYFVICLIDCRTFTITRLIGHLEEIVTMTFSPNSKCLASSSNDSRIFLWDVQSAKILKIIDGDAQDFYSVMTFCPDGNILASSGNRVKMNVKLWDIKTGNLISEISTTGSGCRILEFTDNTTLYVSEDNGCVSRWQHPLGSTSQPGWFLTWITHKHSNLSHAKIAGAHNLSAHHVRAFLQDQASGIPENARLIDPDFSDLHIAANYNDSDKVEELLLTDTSVNTTTITGLTPLHLTAMFGHANATKTLLAHHADFNMTTEDGLTPIDLALQNDRLHLLKILPGNDVKNRDWSPIHLAASNGNFHQLNFLLQLKYDPNLRTDDGRTPLHMAVSCGLSSQLDEADLQVNLDKGYRCIVLLLNSGADINAVDANGLSVLHYAVLQEKVNIILLLIKSKADLLQKSTTAPPYFGQTPLHLIASIGNIQLLKNCLEKAQQLNPLFSLDNKDGMGATLLIRAVIEKEENRDDIFQHVQKMMLFNMMPGNILKKTICVEYLIKQGAYLDAADQHGLTALYYAVKQRYLDMSLMLIKAGAKLEILDEDGLTPFYYALTNGDVQIAMMLIQAGVKVDIYDKNKLTPLYHAIYRSHFNVINQQIPLKPEDARRMNDIQIHKATQSDSPECEQEMLLHIVIKKLLETKRVNLEVVDHEGLTPLYISASRGDVMMVKLLLKFGANPSVRAVNQSQYCGKTILQLVIEKKYTVITSLILKAKPDLSILDANKYSVLDYAIKSNDKSLVKKIRSLAPHLVEQVNQAALVENANADNPMLQFANLLSQFQMLAQNIQPYQQSESSLAPENAPTETEISAAAIFQNLFTMASDLQTKLEWSKLVEAGEYEEAIANIDSFIQKDPTDTHWHLNKALTLSVMRKTDESEICCDFVLKNSTNLDEITRALANKAYTHIRLEKYELGLSTLAQHQDLVTRSSWLHAIKAQLHLHLSDHKLALQNCDIAERINPKESDIFLVRGKYFMSLGQYSKAGDCFTKAFEIDSSQATPLIHRSYSLMLCDSFDSAQSDLEQAQSKAYPKEYHVQSLLGFSMIYRYGAEKLDDAEKLFSLVIASKENRTWFLKLAQLGMGLILFHSKDMLQSQQLFDQALNVRSPLIREKILLAQSLGFLSLGYSEKANEMLDILLEQNPNNVGALIGKAKIYLLNENAELAKQHFDLAIKKSKKDIKVIELSKTYMNRVMHDHGKSGTSILTMTSTKLTAMFKKKNDPSSQKSQASTLTGLKFFNKHSSDEPEKSKGNSTMSSQPSINVSKKQDTPDEKYADSSNRTEISTASPPSSRWLKLEQDKKSLQESPNTERTKKFVMTRSQNTGRKDDEIEKSDTTSPVQGKRPFKPLPAVPKRPESIEEVNSEEELMKGQMPSLPMTPPSSRTNHRQNRNAVNFKRDMLDKELEALETDDEEIRSEFK